MRTISIKQSLYEIKITSLLGVLLAGIFIFTVVLSIVSSNKSAHLSSLEFEITSFEQENRELSTMIISKSSLKAASKAVSELGLNPSKQVMYLNDDVSVAQLR